MERNFADRAFGGLHIGRQVRCVHISLPQIARLPILIEQEVSGILVVLMQIILKAPLLGPGDRDQPFQLGLDQVDLIGIGLPLESSICEASELEPGAAAGSE